MPNLVKTKAIDIDNMKIKDAASGNGSSTDFVLTEDLKAGSLQVFTNGLRTEAYTLNVGTKTVSFTTAPANLEDLIFEYWKV